MTFIKVPFSKPMLVKAKDCNERGSFSYMNPWHENNKTPSSVTEREAPVASRGYFVRTPAVLPLPGLGTVDFLSSLLVKAPPTVFDNDAMAVVLRVLWNVCRSQTFGSLLFLSVFNRSHHLFAGCFQNHIKKYFILDLSLYIIFFVLWIFIVDRKTSSPDATDSTVIGAAAVVFLLNSLFAVKELVQSDYGRRSRYITSLWNIIDLLSIACVWYYTATACFINQLKSGREPLAVITSLLLTAVSAPLWRKYCCTEKNVTNIFQTCST